MPQVVEASVFWGGELFAVKYFTFGERVLFDDVPHAPGIEVRTRIVDAAPRMRRNGWDLPYGAIALAAAFCQSLVVVASMGGTPQPKHAQHDLGHPESLAVTSEVFPGIPGELVGPMTSPIPDSYEAPEEDGAKAEGDDRPPTREELGTFGMVGLLADYRGIGDASSWASVPQNGNAHMWGDAIGEAWGIAGVDLIGIGEGGGGTTLGSRTIDHVHTATGEGFGSAHGRLVGQHTSTTICHMALLSPTTTGHIAPELIQRVVRENEGRLRACYLAGLKRNPKLAGRVTTKFVIARDGTVATATDAGSDLADPEVLSCVQRAFASLEFPATPNGIATVVYPIAMQPE